MMLLPDAVKAKAEIRRLLAGEQLGDRKPSELFRVMQWRSESHNVSAVSKYSSANSDDSSESKLLKELKLLRQEVKELRRSRSFLEIVSILAIAGKVLSQQHQIYVGNYVGIVVMLVCKWQIPTSAASSERKNTNFLS
ncbi:hypothetical protein TNCV_198601 [Trichonephila clavipes]|nr:hypothetical protein TNCV_198601 [Trichonephila clavipes]